MKILLTGQRGYLGSHIHRFLLQNYRDAEVIAFNEDKSSMGAYRDSVDRYVGAEFTHVIHAGAASSTTVSCQEAFDWNYRATQILAESVNADVHFIFFSSCAANDPVTTPYGFSKKAASDWLFDNRDKVCVFVPYNIFGKEVGRTKKFSIPENIVRRQVTYVTKPFVRDYIHIDDCLRMVEKAIADQACGVFEMGTGIGFDFDELCKIGGIDLRPLPCIRPGCEDYPIVGPAPRVAKSPYMPAEVHVKDWIERQCNVQDGLQE
jgi:nucleoside-diphosphate-sugar epimerase